MIENHLYNRDAYELQMDSNKAEFSKVYEKRITELNNKLTSERGSASSAVQVGYSVRITRHFQPKCTLFTHL